MIRPLRRSLLAACFAAAPLLAAEPAPEAAPPPPDVPGSSLVAHAEALRGDALKALQAYAKDNHGCDAPQVLDTQTRRASGKVSIDRAGRLRSGKVAEQWKVDLCGKRLTLIVDLGAHEGEAHPIAIRERS